MKIKHIIGGILIALGVLAVIGAVGHLDYLGECGTRCGMGEIAEALIRTAAGFAAAGVGAFWCWDIEVTEGGRISAGRKRKPRGQMNADPTRSRKCLQWYYTTLERICQDEILHKMQKMRS